MSESKRIARLKTRLYHLREQLRRGFVEAWHCDRHFTVSAQEREVRAIVRSVKAELASLQPREVQA